MIASSVIDRVRDQLQDTTAVVAKRRWSDATLLAWLEDGQKDFISKKPNFVINTSTGAQIDTVPVLNSIPAVNTVGTYLKVHTVAMSCLVDYVLHRAYSKDYEEGNADLGVAYLNKYNAGVAAL
jgi:hypothetical protein